MVWALIKQNGYWWQCWNIILGAPCQAMNDLFGCGTAQEVPGKSDKEEDAQRAGPGFQYFNNCYTHTEHVQ